MIDSELHETRLSALILALERSLRRSYHTSQITPARLSALHTISGIRRCTIGQLAQAEQVTAPTITGIVDALVKSSLIVRSPDQSDRRISRLELTDSGRSVLEEWYAWRADRIEEKIAESGLSDSEVEQSVNALSRLI